MYIPGRVGPPFSRDHVVMVLSIWKLWTLEKSRSSLPEEEVEGRGRHGAEADGMLMGRGANDELHLVT